MSLILRHILVLMAAFLWSILAVFQGSASAQTIDGIAVAPYSDGMRLTVSFVDKPNAPDKAFTLGDGKPRFVMDWTVGQLTLSQSDKALGLGPVRGVRFASRGEGVRIVVDLEQYAKIAARSLNGSRYIVDIQSKSPIKSAPVANGPQIMNAPPKRIISASRYFKNATPYPILKPSEQRVAIVAKPPRRPIIVIDPGHGGYDPGALGKKGTKEKAITFAASKELQRQLLATGRYQVMLTRTKDVFVEHEERLRIARAGGADLFISVHADSAGPDARGATVYTLADRAKTRSRRITNTQNWIMDVDLTEQTDPVGDILVDLAQRSTQSNSTKFADILLGKLKGSTRLINNSHRRAGYFVLLAPDVPAVLLELGFISHPSDEALLRQASHRRKVMRSVTAAINQYFDTQTP